MRTQPPWIVRLALGPARYHLISDAEGECIALVRTREDAVAVGALPEVAIALRALTDSAPADSADDRVIAGRHALKAMRGER